MKGLTKTLVALVLVMTLVATMGISAMAADYSTKTVYQADAKIKVVANASGLEEGDIVTYVATTDASDVNENTIVYINQAEADSEGEATFTYTTSVTNIDASMFFGGNTEDTRKEANKEKGYAIEVKVNGTSAGTVYALEQETEERVIRKFNLSGIVNFAGTKVTGVAFEGEKIDAFVADADTLMVSAVINKAGTLDITTDTDVAFVAPKISGSTKIVDGNLVAVAKAVSGSKFGIVLYKDAAPATFAHEVVEGEGYIVLPALGKNVEGIYAVEVEEIAEVLSGSFNVAAYAFNGETAVVSAPVVVE